MRRLLSTLFVFQLGCLDFENPNFLEDLNARVNEPPRINWAISKPSASDLKKPVRLGDGCDIPEFRVSRIHDTNLEDHLFYRWYLDEVLIKTGIISPKNRRNAVLALKIDRARLKEVERAGKSLPFFNFPRFIDFIVSDRDFEYMDHGLLMSGESLNEGYYDIIRWVTTFSENSC